jgi:signal transduction histidine kinase
LNGLDILSAHAFPAVARLERNHRIAAHRSYGADPYLNPPVPRHAPVRHFRGRRLRHRIRQSMVRPIKTLTSGAARIGSGELDHRIAVSGADELAQLGERFNDMAENLQAERATLEEKVVLRTQELAQANQAKSRFLASASHDLRQPLHALSLFVDELRSRPTEERRSRLNDNLADGVVKLNGMFDAILDTSKIEAGAIKPSLSRFPIALLLQTLQTIFISPAETKGLGWR